MALVISAPLAGAVLPLAEVPDPVFADAMVGPGLAIAPDAAADGDHARVARAPIAGRLAKLKPHAFVVVHAGGQAVLVHLGIDTVRLAGAGFTLLAQEGEEVTAGQPMVRWDPDRVAEQGLSPVCPVVALDAPAAVVRDPAAGHVAPGDALFTWS